MEIWLPNPSSKGSFALVTNNRDFGLGEEQFLDINDFASIFSKEHRE